MANPVTLEMAAEWYQIGDAVHNFDHIQRVLNAALKIAAAEGADIEIVQAAVLLHDSDGALPKDVAVRASHHERAAIFAGQVLEELNWTPERIEAVQHCVRAHRYRSTEAPQTLEAQVVFDADKLDAIGAIGAARALAYAALHDSSFYERPSAQFLQTGELAQGEQHTAYHEFIFKLSKIKDRLYTKTAQQMAAARHEFMQEYFARLGQELAGEV